MSDHAASPAPAFGNWALSVAGVLGSLVIVVAVLGVSYLNTRPKAAVDAQIVADRQQKLADVQAKETQLYNNYSWVDQTKGIVRIPVPEAMRLTAIQLGQATKGKPSAPARLSLAASPAAMTPPPPPPSAPAPSSAPVPPKAPAAPAPTPTPAAPAPAPAGAAN